MSNRSNLHIAAVSAGVTLLLSGVISIALAYPGILSPSTPAGADASASSLPQSQSQSGESAADGSGGADGLESGTQGASATAEKDSADKGGTGAANGGEAAAGAVLPEPPAPPMPTNVDCAVVKCVALTFDDGPDKDVTPKVLDTLRKTGTPATFFQMGKHIVGNEALLQRAVKEGHVLGTHTWDHPQLPLLSRGDIEWQINETKRVSQAATGLTPNLMRPPYGLFNDTVIDVVTASNDAVIMWDVDTEDWKNKNPQVTADLAVTNAHRGAIILMHDVHPSTALALPQIIERLRDKGFTLVTIPQLLGQTPTGSIHYSGDLDE